MRYRIIATILILFISYSAGEGVFKVDKNKINYTFEFSSNLSSDSLLQILYSFEHLKKYSTQFSAVTLISEGKNYYDVEFQLKYLFYISKALYRRTLVADSGLITIEMLQFYQNNSFFPRIISSKTEYRVSQNGAETEVISRQSNLLNKPLNWIYLRVVRNKMDDFAEELKEYIKGVEKIRQSQTLPY